MARTVNCVILKTEAEGLDYAPYPGELGQRIYDNVSKEGWQRWLDHQTMLINENRLTPIEPEARQFLAAEMEKFFFGSGSERPKASVRSITESQTAVLEQWRRLAGGSICLGPRASNSTANPGRISP